MGVICYFFSIKDNLIDYYLKDESNFLDEYEDTDYFDINFIWASGKYSADKTRVLTIDKSWKVLQELLNLEDTTKDKKLSKAITDAPRLVEGEWIMYHKSDEVKELSLELNKIEVVKLFSKRNLLEIGKWNSDYSYYKYHFESLRTFFDSAMNKGYGIVIKIE